jgi:hypothetical protein
MNNAMPAGIQSPPWIVIPISFVWEYLAPTVSIIFPKKLVPVQWRDKNKMNLQKYEVIIQKVLSNKIGLNN